MSVDCGPVIVGTDFSESSARAWDEGRELASRLGLEAELVHVVDGVAASSWMNGEAESWLTRLSIDPSQLTVRFGSAWVELARYASDRDASFVVLGSHGRSGYQPLSIGSTASRVSVKSRSPVVLVSPLRAGESELSGRVASRSRGSAAMEPR